VSAGGAFAVGDFAEGGSAQSLTDNDDGSAGPGFAAGVRYTIYFGPQWVGWTVDASVVASSASEELYEDAVRAAFNLDPVIPLEADPSFWWVNIPILTGPRFAYSPAEGIEMFGKGLLGPVVVIPPDVEVISDWGGRAVYEYDAAAALGLAIEAGVQLSGFLIAARFLWALGREIDGVETISLSDFPTYATPFEKEFPLGVFQILAGWEF
jgi:hypothetical protein